MSLVVNLLCIHLYSIVVLVSTSELCLCACIDVYDSAASKKRKQLATDDDADEGSSDDTK